MANIPTQKENPKGLHGRYQIKKVVVNPDFDEWDIHETRPQYLLKEPDENAEYFVLRLDTGGSDINHIKACRIGVNAYADAIEPFIPELAKDLRERYPLL